MKVKNNSRFGYHSMLLLAVSVGVLCIALQFMAGWELLAYMLSLAVLGGLIGGSSGYEAQERQQLEASYKTAYEWLLLILLFAYAALELAKWLELTGMQLFLSAHWPGLLLALMCGLMGLAGLQIGNNRQNPV